MEVPDEDSLITYEDRMLGEPQYYHAYVVYAQEDKDFVDYLLVRMRAEGFRVINVTIEILGLKKNFSFVCFAIT